MATYEVSPSASSSALRGAVVVFSQLVPFFVLGLIFLGALVTSHDAGLAVPDWPTSYGDAMFEFPRHKWIDGVWYEHVHRLVASVVGFVVCLSAIGVWWIERRRWVRLAALASGFAVCVQGLLGGLTVLYGLPDAISVAHGVLAQTLLVLCIVIAWAVRTGEVSSEGQLSHVRVWSFALAGMVYLQLIIGAMLRHAGAALSVPDFPLFGGEVWPAISTIQLYAIEMGRMASSDYQVAVHIVHRIWGFVILGASCLFVYRARSLGVASRFGLGVGLLVVLQVLLGASVVWTGRLPVVASLHVLGGALLLSLLVVGGLGHQERATK